MGWWRLGHFHLNARSTCALRASFSGFQVQESPKFVQKFSRRFANHVLHPLKALLLQQGIRQRVAILLFLFKTSQMQRIHPGHATNIETGSRSENRWSFPESLSSSLLVSCGVPGFGED